MITAQEQGTLVQLSNLDPAVTSKQVEVMSMLFKARCFYYVTTPFSCCVVHFLWILECNTTV